MAQRSRSRARRDPDDDEEAPPPIPLGGEDDDDDVGNEDVTLEIVAKARRREAGRSAEFADHLSQSSGEEVDEDAVVELVEEATRRKEKKKKRRKLKKKPKKERQEVVFVEEAVEKQEPQVGGTQDGQIGMAESVLTEDGDAVGVSDNIVLRKLLRGPRYFDPGETMMETCFNCGEEGHVAANCRMEKRKKPCFICGLFGHNARQCTQSQECFICRKGGHMAKDCPEKHKRNSQQSTICLRCGDTGHDMFGCVNDYPPNDIKEIKCYICKHNGHLCCADFSGSSPIQVSCYNCAQSGHTGLGCAKQRRENTNVATPTLCYKCGEEGHFARGCTNNTKFDRAKGESSTRTHKRDKGNKEFGIRSAPHDAPKTSKRKSSPFEGRRDASHVKSRSRGGWIVDDPGDLPIKKYKYNGWASPSTPKRLSNNHYLSSGGEYSSPQSSRRHGHGFASSASKFSPTARKHDFSASRFANSHIRFGRT